MKLHNVRYGFATNSSSSHSIVVNATGLVDNDVYGDFGWNYFTAVSKEAKLRWLSAHFNNWSGQDQSNELKKEIFNFSDDQILEYQDDTVDHQSNFGFGTSYIIDDDFKKFMADFVEFISKDDVVVFGGNDNDEYEPSLPPGSQDFRKFDRLLDPSMSDRFAIKAEGDYYTLFNKSSGFKTRVSFGDLPNWEKSTSPELVDLKITDKCNFGCEFCYQGSTKNGKHAPLDRIKKIIDSMAESKVFEVAIGGGEPTDHPDFSEILRYCDSKDMIPNFTTFTDKWINNEDIFDAVMETCGGIGVSVHNVKQLSKIEKIKEAFDAVNRFGSPKIMAQHVVGSAPVSELFEIMNHCIKNHMHLLLLGFKNTGFGTAGPEFEVTPDELVTLIQIMKESHEQRWMAWNNTLSSRPFVPVSLSIDTQMIDLYRKALEDCSIDPLLLASPEGKFSCYWDAVENKIAKSSYCDKDEYYEVLTGDKNEFLEIYSRF